MKYFLLLLILSFTTAFASERESVPDHCERVVSRISVKYSELTNISSRIMFLNLDEPEGYSVDYRDSDNCESDVSDYHILQRRKERVEQELSELRIERETACPRVFPE